MTPFQHIHDSLAFMTYDPLQDCVQPSVLHMDSLFEVPFRVSDSNPSFQSFRTLMAYYTRRIHMICVRSIVELLPLRKR